MWMMLQLSEPEDFVIATGETHTVREFVTLSFATAGIELDWRGEGPAEEGIEHATSKVLVDVNPEFYRPAEVDLLLGNAARAKERLGWTPSTTFEVLATMMTEADLLGPHSI
jgi:GDPmannose 4,6-dehydratase